MRLPLALAVALLSAGAAAAQTPAPAEAADAPYLAWANKRDPAPGGQGGMAFRRPEALGLAQTYLRGRGEAPLPQALPAPRR